MFSLGGWSPQLPTGLPGAPVVLGCKTPPTVPSHTGLLPPTVKRSSFLPLGTICTAGARQGPMSCPTTPPQQRLPSWHCRSLGSSPFARRYLGIHCCFLFLRVLRCFSSPGIPLCPWGRVTRLPAPGFPIRTSLDRCLLAAPQGLSQLATSFIGSQRQGIPRAPLVLSPRCAVVNAAVPPRWR